MRPLVAILTDFGTRDPWVGVMKAVMRRICPDVAFVDLSHEIEAQNLRQAAFTLLCAWRWFPRGTVFLVVVDPGVGTERRPLVVSAGGCRFVAPDNGLLSWLLAEAAPEQAIAATIPAWHLPDASHTFHGRDVFAPLAAHLAAGRAPAELGPAAADLRALPLPRLEVSPGRIQSEILHVDRFGNLVTGIGNCRWLDEAHIHLEPRFNGDGRCTLPATALRIEAGACRLHGARRTYGAVAPGEALAYVGSSGFLELAVNQGSAARRFDLGVGDLVKATWPCSNS